MKITHHGGGCCGIKQICSLGYSPDEFMYGFDAPKFSILPTAILVLAVTSS